MGIKKKQSFLHLDLPLEDETKFRTKLEEMDLKGRQVIRTLVRKWLKGEIK